MKKMWDRILDASIVASFDARGFVRHQEEFDETDLDVDLSGQSFAITGANSGIGFATAQGLAAKGATVCLLCRNEERGQKACESIASQFPGADCHLEIVDVSIMQSTRDFIERFDVTQLNGLILNAGVLPKERSETDEGVEVTFATNVLGGFELLKGLTPALARAKGRVVHVSSGGMYLSRLSLKDWEWKQRDFDGVKAYAMTKRAQVVLTRLWHERLKKDGISVHSMHPGWVDTPSIREALPGFYESRRSMLRTVEQGADTIVWLSAAPEGPDAGGGFWFDRKRRSAYLVPFTKESQDTADRLWQLCSDLSDKL